MAKKIIDVHSHPLIPEYLELFAGSSNEGSMDGVPIPKWSIAHHLEMMDTHGIQKCILSLPEVSTKTAGKDGHALARRLNDALAEIVAHNPDRFGAFAVVPVDEPDASLQETRYAINTLHFEGVSAPTQFQGKFLGEPEYDAWFEELDRAAVPLFVHPAVPAGFNHESRLNVSVVDFMLETTKMITTMVLSGAKLRFPGVPIITTHAGGALPMLAHRISLAGSMPWAFKGGPKLTFEEILSALSTFYFDLTASTNQGSLDLVSKLVPSQQILMGFDFPLMPEQTVAPAIAAFDAYQGFDAKEKRSIENDNAARLFGKKRL